MVAINHVPGLVFERDDFTSQIDGSTTQFVLKREPVLNTVMVLRNGVETREGSNEDYTFSGKTVTIRFPMFVGRTSLVIKYFFIRGEC